MHFTLRQLEIFLAVAKTENISHAAQQLHMSQSAASSAIAQLERQYELTLFERSGKSLQLKPAGAKLQNHAQALLDNARAFEAQLINNAETGHLNVGASLTIGNYLGVRHFSDYLRLYPTTDSNFSIANSPAIINSVLNFELDVGLVEYELNHPNLELIAWRTDELKVFCSPEHPLAAKGTIGVTEAKTENWILREAGSGSRQTFDRAMQGLLPDLNIFLELDHNEAIKRAVEANIGIGCLSEIALSQNFSHGSLVPLNFNGRKMNRTFYFVLNRHRKPSLAVERWMELCRQS